MLKCNIVMYRCSGTAPSITYTMHKRHRLVLETYQPTGTLSNNIKTFLNMIA